MFNKNKGPICPLLKGPCIEHKCMWYTKLMGSNPQTGESIDEYSCAIKFLPLLVIENANEARKNTATLDKMREERVEVANAQQEGMANLLNQALNAFNDIVVSNKQSKTLPPRDIN